MYCYYNMSRAEIKTETPVSVCRSELFHQQLISFLSYLPLSSVDYSRSTVCALSLNTEAQSIFQAHLKCYGEAFILIELKEAAALFAEKQMSSPHSLGPLPIHQPQSLKQFIASLLSEDLDLCNATAMFPTGTALTNFWDDPWSRKLPYNCKSVFYLLLRP